MYKDIGNRKLRFGTSPLNLA